MIQSQLSSTQNAKRGHGWKLMDISTIQNSTQISPEVTLDSGNLSRAITIHKWMDYNTLSGSSTTSLNKDIPSQLSHTHTSAFEIC